jgi:hypothetical protein
MGKRKPKAPQANLGRIEDRAFLAPPTSSAAAAAADAADAQNDQQEPPAWQPEAELEESEDSEPEAKHPSKRRRGNGQQLRKAGQRRRPEVVRDAESDDEDDGWVVLPGTATPRGLPWQFAELAIECQEAAAPSDYEQGVDQYKQLWLQWQPGSGSIGVRLQASPGNFWQGSVDAPGEAEAEALYTLLLTYGVTCAVARLPSREDRSSNLRLSLRHLAEEQLTADAEERRETRCGRFLSAVLRWLVPGFDPEQDLSWALPDQQAMLLASPLCSPRAGASAAAPTSPRSPGPAAGNPAGQPFDASELYAAVKPTGREPQLPAGTTSAFLLPTLRAYQARAAAWMVARELGTDAATVVAGAATKAAWKGVSGTAALAGGASEAVAGTRAAAVAVLAAPAAAQRQGNVLHAFVKAEEAGQDQHQQQQEEEPLHPLWRKVPCKAGHFYANPYNGNIAVKHFSAPAQACRLAVMRTAHPAVLGLCRLLCAGCCSGICESLVPAPLYVQVRGGILADEMVRSRAGLFSSLAHCLHAYPALGTQPWHAVQCHVPL